MKIVAKCSLQSLSSEFKDNPCSPIPLTAISNINTKCAFHRNVTGI